MKKRHAISVWAAGAGRCFSQENTHTTLKEAHIVLKDLRLGAGAGGDQGLSSERIMHLDSRESRSAAGSPAMTPALVTAPTHLTLVFCSCGVLRHPAAAVFCICGVLQLQCSAAAAGCCSRLLRFHPPVSGWAGRGSGGRRSAPSAAERSFGCRAPSTE